MAFVVLCPRLRPGCPFPQNSHDARHFQYQPHIRRCPSFPATHTLLYFLHFQPIAHSSLVYVIFVLLRLAVPQ